MYCISLSLTILLISFPHTSLISKFLLAFKGSSRLSIFNISRFLNELIFFLHLYITVIIILQKQLAVFQPSLQKWYHITSISTWTFLFLILKILFLHFFKWQNIPLMFSLPYRKVTILHNLLFQRHIILQLCAFSVCAQWIPKVCLFHVIF